MRKYLSVCLAILLSGYLAILPSCGSGAGNAVALLTGPTFDLTELTALRVDQLKFTGGIANDKDGVPEPSLYLRCADSDTDIACVGSDELSIVKKDGAAYGRLNAAFVAVDGIKIDSCFDVELVFVEKDSDKCPAPIDEDDDVLWTSPVLTLNNDGIGSLLNNIIMSDDGGLWTYLIAQGDELADELLQPIAPQADNILRIDQLYFKTPAIKDGDASFKVIVSSEATENFRCEASFDSETSGIELEGIIYGNLGIELLDQNGDPCIVTPENEMENVLVTLYISEGDDPLTAEATPLVDLVDNDNDEQNFDDNGYIKFIPIEGVQ